MIVAGIGSAAAFVAITSLVVWLAGLGRAPVEARLRALGQPKRASAVDSPFGERVILPVFDGVTRALMQLLPQTFVARTARQLVTAGRPLTTSGFFTLVLLTGGLLPLLAILVVVSAPPSQPTLGVLLIIGSISLGVLGPFVWLRRRVRQRKLVIWKSLGDALDMVTISVEAGLGLDAALRQVSEKLRGPLSDEISLTLREIGMGRPRKEALRELAERADVSELTTFVNAVIQAESLGTSLGRVLRAQSLAIRTRRRQRAEETARKAPVKMVFPLVLCIMPSFFIVILGPIVIRLVNYLSE